MDVEKSEGDDVRRSVSEDGDLARAEVVDQVRKKKRR